MSRVLVTTVPFQAGAKLAAAGIGYTVNPLFRRLTEGELCHLLQQQAYQAMIAGTEPITEAVMQAAPTLKLIARVGVGLDNVDLPCARARGIAVSYTPDAPALAVAELTIGMIFSLLRGLPQADRALRRGQWTRILGMRLAHCTVGVIGIGRIGSAVVRMCHALGARRILVNNLSRTVPSWMPPVEWVEKETLYREADVVTLHVPLTEQTRQMIGEKELHAMKPTAILLNTSRGTVVEERALADALQKKTIAAAGLDVFEQEPYGGELTLLENCLLTCHMGSMSKDCRAQMEQQAEEETVRFFAGQPLQHPVP